MGKLVLWLFVDFKSSLFTKENVGEKFPLAKRTIIVKIYIGLVIISVSTLDLIFFLMLKKCKIRKKGFVNNLALEIHNSCRIYSRIRWFRYNWDQIIIIKRTLRENIIFTQYSLSSYQNVQNLFCKNLYLIRLTIGQLWRAQFLVGWYHYLNILLVSSTKCKGYYRIVNILATYT